MAIKTDITLYIFSDPCEVKNGPLNTFLTTLFHLLLPADTFWMIYGFFPFQVVSKTFRVGRNGIRSADLSLRRTEETTIGDCVEEEELGGRHHNDCPREHLLSLVRQDLKCSLVPLEELGLPYCADEEEVDEAFKKISGAFITVSSSTRNSCRQFQCT